MSDIQYTYPLIHNKVTSPHYVTPTLRRARLLDWLHGNAECRAVVIAADAGYGKTTLLWQWEREVDFPCYWYKLDRNDRDWSLHISYLIESISQRHAGFGRRAHSMLQQLGGPGSSRPGVAAFLLSEMHQRLTEPCTFIIDDWQYVNSVTEVRGLWNQMLRDAPPTCRFVFASRAKPKLQFARFKTHAGYGELRTNALRFTDREIDELFREIYRDPLDAGELAELERRTEGWAASLQLVEVSLRERHTPESRRRLIDSISSRSDTDLFAFLAEEVLDQQTDDTRNFLLSTSIVHQITPDLAERLAGVHDGKGELSDLEQGGLFTYRLDDDRYRYHNLFRDFLVGRLTQDRSNADIAGLHIHAASYFETSEQWPEAIHHYLRAGLQRQAARLIARFGEGVVAEGRLGLVDEWLQDVPAKAVRENARLSLLYGEAAGIRGFWRDAFEALERSREYFARKGDRRMEALARLKQSTVYAMHGDAAQAAETARRGLTLVPPDAQATRLRLEGNLAISDTWIRESLGAAATRCKRIAVEAAALGLDHFGAIALHNVGSIQLHMGLFAEAAHNLERAAKYWNEVPSSPFADNSDLVVSLLALDKPQIALQIAQAAVRSTAPWPRPQAEAQYGRAAVFAYEGQFAKAIEILDALVKAPDTLGGAGDPIGALLIDCLYLTHASAAELLSALEAVEQFPRDPRYEALLASARSLVCHAASETCGGECLASMETLHEWDDRGAKFLAVTGYVKVGVLSLSHGGKRNLRRAVEGLSRARAAGLLRHLRWWLRGYQPHWSSWISEPGGPDLLISLLEADPEAWRGTIAQAIPTTHGLDRERLLAALVRFANKGTIADLRELAGDDVAEARRALVQQQAPRIYLRAFGPLTIHMGNWNGPTVRIEKKRQRMLLGLLVAHSGRSLTRDMAIDVLWPDADPAAAVNSLNQTVFQLRRVLDERYRDGESAQYILSTVDSVELNPELVRTDLEEFRRLGTRADPSQLVRTDLVALVRGEFLEDLRYEDWVATIQTAVHAEVRGALMSLVAGRSSVIDPELAVRAACALIALDEFDEKAHLALARILADSGKRAAARDAIRRFARRVRDDLDEPPSDDVIAMLKYVGATAAVQ